MSGPFNFVYCLAGKGKRFKDQDIFLPKYLLRLEDGDTILEKSIKAFNFSSQINLHVVINHEHKDFEAQIKEILLKHGNAHKIVSVGDTQGQAETAFIGCNSIDNDYPIFFFNGDTILKGRDVGKMSEELRREFAGAIDVFLEDREHFSFVKLSEEQLVEEIAEKVPISRYATTGLYGFSNAAIYNKYFNSLKTEAEMYISDVYNLMLEKNEKIKGYISENGLNTIILGTPEEYFSNKHKL
jgi:dTDP-glucose pyrophosphorylase